MGMDWLKQKADETGSTERLPFKGLSEEYMDVWQLRGLGNKEAVVTKVAEVFRGKLRSGVKKYFQQGQRPQPKPLPFRKTNPKYNLPQINPSPPQ